jgi:heterodisulfide reductase subunit B
VTKYSFYMGCQTPARLEYCEISTRKVLDTIGVQLADLQDAGCCGCPYKPVNYLAALTMAARVLAQAEKTRLDLLVLCSSCLGWLSRVRDVLIQEEKLLEETNALLNTEGLSLEKGVNVVGLLQVLHSRIGDLEGLKVATMYGCHLLRPSRHMRIDDPENPRLLDELVEITGARSIYWPLKLWCCGATTLPVDSRFSMNLARKKIVDAKRSGADCIVTICPSCQLTLDSMQPIVSKEFKEEYDLPVIFYPQLLGLAMGIGPKELGLERNRIRPSAVLGLASN